MAKAVSFPGFSCRTASVTRGKTLALRYIYSIHNYIKFSFVFFCLGGALKTVDSCSDVTYDKLLLTYPQIITTMK